MKLKSTLSPANGTAIASQAKTCQSVEKDSSTYELSAPLGDKVILKKGKAYTREQFKRRYQDVHIYVDERQIPKHVWYQWKSDTLIRDDCKHTLETFYGTTAGEILPASSRKKWLDPPVEKQAYLHFVYSHVAQATQHLHITNYKKSKTWRAKYFQDCDDIEGLVSYPMNDVSEACEVTDESFIIPLKIMGISCENAVVNEFDDDVHIAFIHGMHDSAGRDGVKAILEYAGKIAFGYDFLARNFAKIHSFGTAQHPSESFPVDVLEPSQLPYDVLDLRRRLISRACSDNGTSASSSSSTSSEKQWVHPDIVVTTVDENGWAKYLLVCELEPGYQPFTTKQTARLMCQMIGACMFQTEVFGLLMNAAAAKLVWLKHDPLKKELVAHDLMNDMYWFRKSDSHVFNTVDLNRLIFDLVVILDHGKENIHEVQPLPDRPAENSKDEVQYISDCPAKKNMVCQSEVLPLQDCPEFFDWAWMTELHTNNTGTGRQDSKEVPESAAFAVPRNLPDACGASIGDSSSSGSSSCDDLNIISLGSDSDDAHASKTVYTIAPPVKHTPETETVKVTTSANNLHSLRNLPTSHWNDTCAHVVYSSLKVKRYFMEPDYILCPEYYITKQPLRVSDIIANRNLWNGTSWATVGPKLQRIVAVFDENTSKIADIKSPSHEVYQKISAAVSNNIHHLPNEEVFGRSFRDLKTRWHSYITRLLNTLGSYSQNGENPPEECYEDYLYQLIKMFDVISGMNICVKKSFMCPRYELFMPSLGAKQRPRPDLFLSVADVLLAIVEVKVPGKRQEEPYHKTPSVSSSKEPKDNSGHAADASPADAVFEEPEECKANDEYEKQESELAEAQKHELPCYMRNLDVEEKKQMRCFLPQLLGQLLASFPITDTQCISAFQVKYAPLRLGIGQVGMKVRFVSMVLRDETNHVLFPTAADIETHPSVKPTVYITQELNLFLKEDLDTFFQILFALCCLDSFNNQF